MELFSTRLTKKENPLEYNIKNITGLASKCDWFIIGSSLVNLKETDNPRFIFISQRFSSLKYFISKILSKINNSFILLLCDEDCTFPLKIGDKRIKMQHLFDQKDVDILLENKYLLHIFVENLDTIHPKMSNIPLGMCYPLDGKEKIYGNPPKIDINKKEFINIYFDKKKKLCFCTHRTRWKKKEHREQMLDRHNVDILCQTKWKNFVRYYEKLPNKEFVNRLKNSKFCLCVHGGGLDPCPRFFEAIIYGSIPVIKHSTLDPIFSNRFPVVYVDNWNEFLLKKLEELRGFYEDKENRKRMLYFLTMEYWWNIIINKYDQITS